jgi:hypothetical protein
MSAIPAATSTSTSTVSPHVWLRRWLALDALVTGANALVYLLAAGPVGRLIGLDTALLVGIGAFLLPYAAAVGLLARRQDPPVFAVRCVVEANIAWTVGSFAALALWLEPSTAGILWIPAQAAVVTAFAALQYGALRSSSR